VWAGSFYTQRLDDPKAVYVAPSNGGDDTTALQQAINRVQETAGQGVVLVGPGQYRLTNTIYVWPGIRLIGYGVERPTFALVAGAPGFGDAAREKVLLFFAGRRPGYRRGRVPDPGAAQGPVPDATPGTFYSALANIDIEIGADNPGAVAVRARYAQHCFLAHSDFRLGPALAGVHEGGNVIEDVHFFGGTHAVWSGKPSPGWQFTLIDCSFEGQRGSAILEREAGLTLIRPRFRRVPAAVEIEPERVDELSVVDGRLEEISGPAFIFGVEKNPRQQINLERITCRDTPCFAQLRDSGKQFKAPGRIYEVATFSHGLRYADMGAAPQISTVFEASPLKTMPASVPSDLAHLPSCENWVNAHDLGAKGDASADDTEALQKAIASHRTIYLPCGFYIVRDTLKLKPDTVLIGLHPSATQIILPDGTPAFQSAGEPKALLEAPPGGSNIVIGIGLYTSGKNQRAVAALWKAGAQSLMNDVRFLGGHGTPLPDGSRENPYNSNHSADPNPERVWDSQFPSLWVTEGGGGTFLDIWTPSTFAKAGMLVSGTETEGRVYQMSSEHHVRNEVQVRRAAHWRFYALQTEEERGESGLALPIEVESSRDISFLNYHGYRVISSVQPFPYAAKISDSRDVHFRNVHCDSNSKVSFDASVFDQTYNLTIWQREFCALDISDSAPAPRHKAASPVVASGAKVEKLAGRFHNISGGAAGPGGDFYFLDARRQRIYRWSASARALTTVRELSFEPVNLAVDEAGNLIVFSYGGDAAVYALRTNGDLGMLKPEAAANQTAKHIYLPVSDWRLNRESLSEPTAYFRSPDGTTVVPVGEDFLSGAMSWGIKSSPPVRSFGLGKAIPGKPFYVTEEAELRTWAAEVNAEGRLSNFRLMAEQGGEGVAADAEGNVYVANGEIYVYNPAGKLIDTIEVPERPTQLVFGGADGRTLFIPARSSLYSMRMRWRGR
jgi:sugar lactone lactonase YvrE